MLPDEIAWAAYDGSYAVKMKPGFGLFLRPGCEYSRKRFLYRVAETNELDFLARQDLAGMVCADVGANIGYWSAWLLQQGVAEVHAFEPDPVSFDYLLRNVAERAILNAMAVTAASGEVTLYLDPERSNDNRTIAVEARPTVQVLAVALDDYARARNLRFDLVKLDIQGAEMEAIDGATTIIARDRPVIVMEATPRVCGIDPADFHSRLGDLMQRLDSEAYRVVDGALVAMSYDERFEYEGNIIINPSPAWF